MTLGVNFSKERNSEGESILSVNKPMSGPLPAPSCKDIDPNGKVGGPSKKAEMVNIKNKMEINETLKKLKLWGVLD